MNELNIFLIAIKKNNKLALIEAYTKAQAEIETLKDSVDEYREENERLKDRLREIKLTADSI
jgi:hypothetical protein